jgi:cytochrome c biogenesis protein CcmG/thiol:disulfide interchange protein DsbE
MSEVTSEPVNESEEPVSPRSAVKRYLVFGVMVVFIGFLAWGLFTRNQTQPTSGPAPEFTLTLYDGYHGNTAGSPVKLSDLRGKVVLINFWASWCIPCADEAPDLEAAYQLYKDKGVVFLGIDWLDNEADARNYLSKFGITFANGPDLQTKIGPTYRISGVPETYIIDKQGNVRFTKISPVSVPELSAEFDKLLKE